MYRAKVAIVFIGTWVLEVLYLQLGLVATRAWPYLQVLSSIYVRHRKWTLLFFDFHSPKKSFIFFCWISLKYHYILRKGFSFFHIYLSLAFFSFPLFFFFYISVHFIITSFIISLNFFFYFLSLSFFHSLDTMYGD